MSETEHYERQSELREEEQLRQAAVNQAMDPELRDQTGDPRFVETLGDPDISRGDDPDDDLEGELATELSRIHMLANITREEYQRRQVLNQNKADRAKAEHPPDRGPGSKCTGEVREIMLAGEEDTRPPLTPAMARRFDEALEVRGSMESLAKKGKAFDGLTKIQTAAETHTGNGQGGSGSESTFGRARKLLPGGGS